MATKIRLQRGGRKGYAVYRIVVADVRAPRDGKFIEKLGTYNPNTNPATVDLNFDRSLYWVQTGAQPTDTARSILKREGVYMMKHLLGGVKKGAFDEAAAQKKFNEWKSKKEQTLESIRGNEEKLKKEVYAKNLEFEKKQNETLAKKLAEKKAAAVAEEQAAEAAKTAEVAEATQEQAEVVAEETIAEPAAETQEEKTETAE